MAQRLYDIGLIYRLQGELELSHTTLENCLTICHQAENKFLESKVYHALGSVFHDQGEYDRALKQFDQSLSISSVVSPLSLTVTTTLLALIILLLDLKKTEQANQYFKQLKEIKSDIQIERIQLDYQLDQALLLKSSSRLKDKMVAQDKFNDIANRPKIERIQILNYYSALIRR